MVVIRVTKEIKCGSGVVPAVRGRVGASDRVSRKVL